MRDVIKKSVEDFYFNQHLRTKKLFKINKKFLSALEYIKSTALSKKIKLVCEVIRGCE